MSSYTASRVFSETRKSKLKGKGKGARRIIGRRERGGRLRGWRGRRDYGGTGEEVDDRGFEGGLRPHLLPLPFGVTIFIANLIVLQLRVPFLRCDPIPLATKTTARDAVASGGPKVQERGIGLKTKGQNRAGKKS
ncbi:hypothetical protein SLEP1_g14903 [Rubroshorea leprosula]|uniref:Uncharacterized protein n=1 Tax=Rubroshorea leprosula TaxID=152421 RepID=A0AAV5IXB7_9ROSI|nr:hypothetical protein SLEP1_g14903 [Rubroshorea leprosula]